MTRRKSGKPLDSIVVTPLAKWQAGSASYQAMVDALLKSVPGTFVDAGYKVELASAKKKDDESIEGMPVEALGNLNRIEAAYAAARKTLEEAGYDPDAALRAYRKVNNLNGMNTLPAPAPKEEGGVRIMDPSLLDALTRPEGIRIGWNKVYLKAKDGALVVTKAEAEVLTPQR